MNRYWIGVAGWTLVQFAAQSTVLTQVPQHWTQSGF